MARLPIKGVVCVGRSVVRARDRGHKIIASKLFGLCQLDQLSDISDFDSDPRISGQLQRLIPPTALDTIP